MLNLLQRNVIQRYLDGGMSPEDIADFLGRVNDLGPLDIVTIKSAAYDLLNERAAAGGSGKPVLTVIAGGAA